MAIVIFGYSSAAAGGVLNMESFQRGKDVQKLTGCITALNKFVSHSIDKYVSFFNVLQESKNFIWTPKYEEAFKKPKEYLGHVPTLFKPLSRERLFIYLAISKHAVSLVLVKYVAAI